MYPDADTVTWVWLSLPHPQLKHINEREIVQSDVCPGFHGIHIIEGKT